jgi:hypothetical protein
LAVPPSHTHEFPHAPQLLTSVSVSALHVHCPPAQMDALEGHCTVQAPQLFPSVWKLTETVEVSQ